METIEVDFANVGRARHAGISALQSQAPAEALWIGSDLRRHIPSHGNSRDGGDRRAVCPPGSRPDSLRSDLVAVNTISTQAALAVLFFAAYADRIG